MTTLTQEVFANAPTGIVTAGGMDAPSAGTFETLTVNASVAFAVASTGSTPQTFFYAMDPAQPTEVMLVTVCPGGTGSQTWTVQRGVDGTTPVTHAANYTIVQVLSHASLVALQNGTPDGLQWLTGGGTINSAMITAAQNAGYPGIFFDPRFAWAFASGFQLKDIATFKLRSVNLGSIGYNGQVINAGGFTTAAGADGIQIYSDGTNPTQGVRLQGMAIAGANTNGVVHLGGRQRDCILEDCLVQNTGTVSTTVATTVTASASFSLVLTSASGFSASGGQAVVLGTLSGLLVPILVTYTGVSSNTLTGCSAPSGMFGALTSGNAAAPLQAGIITDTALANFNGENNVFRGVKVASASGIAIGIGTNNQSQNANDCIWDNVTTNVGSVFPAVLAIAGGGHNFIEFYDRSAPAANCQATMAVFGATVILIGGEDQNNSSGTVAGVALLVYGSGTLVSQSRNLSIGSNSTTNNNVGYVIAGRLVARGFSRWSGTITIAGGTLDISDPSGNFNTTTPLTVAGSSGILVADDFYTTGSMPTITFTGTKVFRGSGSILAATQYAPGSSTALTVSTTALSIVSASVNTGSFIAPLSGAVIVTTSFVMTEATANIQTSFGLGNGNTTPVCDLFTGEVSSAAIHQFGPIMFLVTGLTPGTTYNLSLLAAVSANSLSITAFGTTTPGVAGAPVIMTVTAV